MVWAAVMTGCNGSRGELVTDDEIDLAGRTALIEAIGEQYNERVGNLQELYAAGAMEVEWRDEHGPHTEPGVDFKLWVRQPRETALRIDKLGTVYLWLGSNDDRYWLFDLTNDDERYLLTRPHDHPLIFDAEGSGPDSALRLEPMMLLDLLSLTAIEFDSEQSHYNGDAHEWVLIGEGSSGAPLRLRIHEHLTLPHRIDALNGSGEVIAYSELENDQSVRVPGRSQLTWPRLAMRINLRSPQRNAEITLTLDSTMVAATLEGQPADRVFDLERLRESMKPDVIDDDRTSAHPNARAAARHPAHHAEH